MALVGPSMQKFLINVINLIKYVIITIARELLHCWLN